MAIRLTMRPINAKDWQDTLKALNFDVQSVTCLNAGICSAEFNTLSDIDETRLKEFLIGLGYVIDSKKDIIDSTTPIA